MSSSGVSTSELLKLEMFLETVCVESSESMRGELEEKLGRGEEVKSERELREDWSWNLDGKVVGLLCEILGFVVKY